MTRPDWKYLKVEKLFNHFDYTLRFPASADPLILTGPNGYGKTTLLEVLNALAHEDYLYFWSLPFKRIRIGFGEYEITIEREFFKSMESGSDSGWMDEMMVSFSYVKTVTDNNKTFMPLRLDKHTMQFLAERVKGFDPDNLEKAGKSLKNKANEVLRKSPVLAEFQIILRQMKVVFVPAERLRQLTLSKSEMDSIRSMTYSLQIALSRLERSSRNSNDIDDLLGLSEGQEESPVEETILKLSRKLKETMMQARQRYSRLVETNNRRVIERMLSADNEGISQEEYERRARELLTKYSSLLKFGLIEELKLIEYSASNAPQLKVYLEVLEENLRSYDRLTAQLQIFLEWIERNKFRGKRISADPQSGLTAVDEPFKNYIPLTKLSSGEKHEIILAYWLAFEVPDGALLLIDEPELSLHVAWQIKFIPELKTISERKNLVSIVATHAPFIINEQWDKTVDLELLDREKETVDR